MNEVIYKFIKTQGKATQNVIFDALAYFDVYGKMPEGLLEKYVDILNLILDYDKLTAKGKSPNAQLDGRGAPKGNRNNRWCRAQDNESTNNVVESTNTDTKKYNSDTNNVQTEYNSGTNNTKESTNKVQISTNGVQKSTNKGTNTDTKEVEKESEKLPLTPLKEKEKEEEKEENYVKEDPLKAKIENTTLIPLTPPQPKKPKSGALTITPEELADKVLFKKRFPYVADEYLDAFIKWLTYKRERRESYKSETSLKTCYNQLVARSNKDPNQGMQVVDQSIGNNWSGLFELKGKSQKLNTMVMHNLSDPHRYDGMEEMFNG